MSGIDNPWKILIATFCRDKGLDNSSSISTMEKRIKNYALKKHKSKQLVGRPPCPLKKIAIRALKRLKLSESGNLVVLRQRYQKAMQKKKDTKSVTMKINKNYVSADDLQKLLHLKPGVTCSFNGKKKKLIRSSSGGFRWKAQ